MDSSFIISQADPRPMYMQLMEQICQRVATADWPAGHELPSIRVLAAEVRVSVITVKRAYLELEREGVIITRQGKGSFVSDSVDLGLRLRARELEAQLHSVASLSLTLGVPLEELEARLRVIREELGQGKS
jgi:GntR family transcriptional regulator